MRLRPVLIVTALILACAAAPAHAQADPDLDKRLDRIERLVRQLREIVVQARQSGDPVQVRIVGDPDPDMMQAKRRLDDLEGAITTLNGQVDGLTRDIQLARRAAQEQRAGAEAAERGAQATQARLDELLRRVQALEIAAAAPPPQVLGEIGPEEAGEPSDDPAEAFAQAKRLLLAESYPAAVTAFQEYIERYPEAEQTPEARYWLGEALFMQKAHADAATAYIGAIRGWPKTPWAPNAVVKLARALIALEKPQDACRTLSEFGRRYPDAPAAIKSRAAAARAEAKCS
jgi:tol-pal system protein YbgF